MQSFDVVIIGGGPAGSTAGTWLSKQGHKTLLCEKEIFPRFHIGESLLPSGNKILQEIGVWDKICAAGFVKKYGAQFTLPDRSRTVRNIFAAGLVGGLEQTYQVERSRFDKILIDHAVDTGCEVRQGTIVSNATQSAEGWILTIRNLNTGKEDQVSAKWVIDASGRHCVMGRVLGLKKESIPYPGRFAVFNHFKGFKRASGKEGGDIIVLRLKDAWFWVIPITETNTSVGIVAQKGARSKNQEGNEEFFWRRVHESSYLTDALSGATALQDYRVESDYCFSYGIFGKDKALLTGDAASFIDPVFSSGVYLALESGLLAAKTIEAQLKTGSKNTSPRMYFRYTQSMKGRIATMRKLIESYYDNKSFEVFMFPKSRYKLPEAINSILAGCTKPPLAVKWRFWLFRRICGVHNRWPIVPQIHWRKVSNNKTKNLTKIGH